VSHLRAGDEEEANKGGTKKRMSKMMEDAILKRTSPTHPGIPHSYMYTPIVLYIYG
jgi:hypothetical protein